MWMVVIVIKCLSKGKEVKNISFGTAVVRTSSCILEIDTEQKERKR
mgnify:CR=1 FL=1